MEARPFRAVLFDWDGTLADSVELVTVATNEVLRNHGYRTVTAAQIHEGMRYPTAERFSFHALEPLGRELADALADEFYVVAERLGHQYVRLFPGVREMLAALHGAGLPMGIVTNNRSSVVRSIVTHLELVDWFPVIVGELDVPAPKPDPEPVLIALESMFGSRDPDGVAFVGDSSGDAAAALAAGVLPVGAGWPRESVVHAHGNPYVLVATTPHELVELTVPAPGTDAEPDRARGGTRVR